MCCLSLMWLCCYTTSCVRCFAFMCVQKGSFLTPKRVPQKRPLLWTHGYHGVCSSLVWCVVFVEYYNQRLHHVYVSRCIAHYIMMQQVADVWCYGSMWHYVHAHARLVVSCAHTWVVVYALHLDHTRVASHHLCCYNYFMCTLWCVTCVRLLASSMSWGSCHQLRLMNARVSQWLRSTCESKLMWEILSLVCAAHCDRVAHASRNFLRHVVWVWLRHKIFMCVSHSRCDRFARSSRRV